MTSDERKQMIREMWVLNRTGSEIAKAIGISRNAVMGHIHRMVKDGKLSLKDPVKQASVRKKVKAPLAFPRPKKTVQQIFSEKPLDAYFEEIKSSAVSGTPVTLMELTPSSCRFAVSGKIGSEYMFCNNPIDKVSYCAEHYKMCYTPLTRSSVKKRYAFR